MVTNSTIINKMNNSLSPQIINRCYWGSNPPPLDNKQTIKKTSTDLCPLQKKKRPYPIIQLDNNINYHVQYIIVWSLYCLFFFDLQLLITPWYLVVIVLSVLL